MLNVVVPYGGCFPDTCTVVETLRLNNILLNSLKNYFFVENITLSSFTLRHNLRRGKMFVLVSQQALDYHVFG
jgi:hypothetical protein